MPKNATRDDPLKTSVKSKQWEVTGEEYLSNASELVFRLMPEEV